MIRNLCFVRQLCKLDILMEMYILNESLNNIVFLYVYISKSNILC